MLSEGEAAKLQMMQAAKTLAGMGSPFDAYYKYRALTTRKQRRHAEAVFIRNEVYFAPPSSFNDPFDGRFSMDMTATPVERKTAFARYLHTLEGRSVDEAHAAAERRFGSWSQADWAKWDRQKMRQAETHRDRIGVFCLTRNNRSIPMWSYYADSHRGICLVFQAMSLDQVDFLSPVRVHYSRKYPTPNVYKDDPFQKVKTMCLWKSREWKHEDEHRLLDMDGHGIRRFPDGTLKGVILGMAIPPAHEELVRKWASAHATPIRLRRAVPREDQYAIDFREEGVVGGRRDSGDSGSGSDT